MTADAEPAGPAVPKCPRCQHEHPIFACPYVKALEFEDADLTLIRRIEFLTPGDYGPAPAPPKAEKGPAAGPQDYPRLGENAKE